jgi:hypothetical protein
MHEPNSVFPSVVTPVSGSPNGFAASNQDGINAKTIGVTAKHAAVIDTKGKRQGITLFIKNCVFWDVTSCGSCKNRRFGGTLRLLYQGDKNR